jgi:hypothetical protein
MYVDLYIQKTVNESKLLQANFENAQIDPSKVFRGANGSFLWANLVLKELAKARSKSSFHRYLHRISQESTQLRILYTEILTKFEGETRKWVREIIKWVVTASRELEVQELREAVEWSLEDKLSQFQRFLEVECGSILTISRSERTEGRIRFVHETLRSFLLNPKVCPLEFCVDEPSTHSYILGICAKVLACPANMTYLARYAATQWVTHLTGATASHSERLFVDNLAHVSPYFSIGRLQELD